MKQENKVKRIFQAFTEESDLSDDIVKQRREICNGCIFNSRNADEETMSLMQRQKKRLGDFCLKCGCFTHKKTSRASEACGMEDVGLKPLWNRVLLKTVDDTDLDIKNLSPDICNLKISDLKENYELDFYTFEKIDQPILIEILDKDLETIKLSPYCDCVTVSKKSEDDLIYEIIVDTSKFERGGNVIKTIEIKYTKNKKNYTSKILIKGKYEL